MIGSTILADAYLLCNKTESTFLDGSTTTQYRILNQCYGKRILDILTSRVDKNATMQDAYTTLKSTSGLVAGDNGYNGEYAFPTDLLKPVRVEVKFTDDGVLKPCKFYDSALNENSEFDEDEINRTFSENEPYVEFTRNSFRIRPLKTSLGDITGGIYIMYEKRQSDFTSSTSPSDIEQNLQDLLAYDLASYEHIMHSGDEKYTPTYLQLFNAKRQEIEAKFFNFYRNNLPTRKTITFKFNNYN